MRFLQCDSQAAAAALSAELWAYARPAAARDPRDVTTHALPVALDGADWGLLLPDEFALRRWAGYAAGRAATVELEKLATRGATSTLVGRVAITMDQLAALAPARVRTL